MQIFQSADTTSYKQERTSSLIEQKLLKVEVSNTENVIKRKTALIIILPEAYSKFQEQRRATCMQERNILSRNLPRDKPLHRHPLQWNNITSYLGFLSLSSGVTVTRDSQIGKTHDCNVAWRDESPFRLRATSSKPVLFCHCHWKFHSTWQAAIQKIERLSKHKIWFKMVT